MNAFHRRYCRSDAWARHLDNDLLPWVLEGVEVGGTVLEVGPGPGLTTARLSPRAGRYVAVEIDAALARIAAAAAPGHVVRGDGTRLPLRDGSVDLAVCFTMLHHVPTAGLQDDLLAEMGRVLRPGGVLAGSDSRTSLRFRVIHIGDTMTLVDPATLGSRLEKAGMVVTRVDTGRRAVRFLARKAA